jgi:hypothetical protein
MGFGVKLTVGWENRWVHSVFSSFLTSWGLHPLLLTFLNLLLVYGFR